MATFFIDYEGGNDNYAGTSFVLLASGSDGAITSSTFSSASASFPNDNTIAPTKNLAWFSNSWYLNSNATNINIPIMTGVAGPSGISCNVNELEEISYPTNLPRHLQTVANYAAISSSTQYTISVYAKSAGKDKVVLRFDNDAKSARFNLSSGTVEQTGASATSSITSVGNGWYRLSITAISSAATDLVQIALCSSSYSGLGLESYFSDGGADGTGPVGIYISGFQIEAGSSVTSYELPPSQYLSIYNGTSYVHFWIAQRLSSTSLRLVAVNGGTALSNQTSRQYYVGGRWKSFEAAIGIRINPADFIRVMGSPNPTSLGINGTWTSKRLQSALNITSSTNATPIAITSNNHGYSTGDTVVITGHTTNTNANGTWEITVTGTSTFTLTGSTGNGVGGATGTTRLATSCVVKLASEVTKNIVSHGNRGTGRTAWTASTNVTATLDTADFKEGDCADSIAVGASFTTGLAAYKAIGSALDLSGYQQLSFWIKQTVGTIGASGALSIKLCSDTAGATAVNTFNIENLTALNRWVPITIDLATNLGSSIQSVGFYVNTDNAAQTFLISNIIAVKSYASADSLSLWSLIGKNTSGEPWYPIQSINGTRIMLDCDNNTIPNSASANRGYYGTTETVTTYKLETIKTLLQATQTAVPQNIWEGGVSVAYPITINGGWDRTNMTSQSLSSTFFDARTGFGYGLNGSNRSFLNISKLSFVRCFVGYYANVTIFSTFNFDHIVGNATTGAGFPSINKSTISGGIFSANNTRSLQIQGVGNTISGVKTISGSNFGISLEDASNNKIYDCVNYNLGQGMLCLRGVNNFGQNIISSGCNYGINSSNGAGGNIFKNCIFGDSITTDAAPNSHSETVFINTIFNSATEFAGVNSYADLKAYSQNHDNIPGYHYIYNEFGWINSTTSVRYANSGIAWQFNLNTNPRTLVNKYPMYMPVGTVAVSANSLVTIKAWFRRSDPTMTIGLKIRGGQIVGVSNDVSSYMTAAIDTWQQISLSFTPTEDGVVEIIAECYGASAMTGYMDDITITQV
jgi:hypothetical protein